MSIIYWSYCILVIANIEVSPHFPKLVPLFQIDQFVELVVYISFRLVWQGASDHEEENDAH